MFSFFYNKYKIEILKSDLNISIKGMKLYEKIFLLSIIVGPILSVIFILLKINLGIYISVCIIIFGFIFFVACKNIKSEQKRVLYEVMEPFAKERMKKIVNLLIEFDIDILDDKQLDNLIYEAKKEKSKYNIWSDFENLFNGMMKYIIIPIVTIFLSEFFKGVGLETVLKRAIIIISICSVGILFLSAFSISFNDFFNKDICNLNYLIKDIEEVKVFSKKAAIFAEQLEAKNKCDQ